MPTETVKMQTTQPIVSATDGVFGQVHFSDTDVYLKGLQPPNHTAGAPDPSVDPIKTIEHFRVKPRWLFVRVETKKGIVGWGEATLEGQRNNTSGRLTQVAEIKYRPFGSCRGSLCRLSRALHRLGC
jgi:galactonate dehydratase